MSKLERLLILVGLFVFVAWTFKITGELKDRRQESQNENIENRFSRLDYHQSPSLKNKTLKSALNKGQ
jgi:hypothetical protein